MGNSASIEKTLNTSAITKNISETSIKNKANVNSESIQMSEQTVEFAGYTEGCDINIAQTADLEVESSTNLDVESIVNSRSDIASKLKIESNTYVDRQTESLSTAWGNKAKLKERISQEIENITKNVFTKENVTNVVNKAVQVTKQGIKFGGVIVCKEDGSIDVEQNATAKIVVDTLIRDVTDLMYESKVFNDMGLKTTTGASSKDTGIIGDAGRAISSIIGAITGPILAIIVIAVILLIGLIFMFRQKRKGNGGGGLQNYSYYEGQ